MMRLLDFARAPDQEFDWLKEQLDGMPPGRSYRLRCRLPGGCRPASADICFYHSGDTYGVFSAEPVTYQGNHAPLTALFTGQPVTGRFPELRSFIRSLDPPADVVPASLSNGAPAPAAPPPSPAPPEINMDTVTDLSQVSVPAQDEPEPLVFQDLRGELNRIIYGQEEAVEAVAYYAYLHLNKKDPKKPLSLLLSGPTGTGKSELAKNLEGALDKLGRDYDTVWTDLNTFTEAHSVYRLIGSPPGYVGYDDPPVFEAVVNNPNTVFIFDELDKAHPQVLKTFMAILDEGRCAARKELPDHSRTFDFRHCIFLFTSNFRLEDGPKRRTIGFAAPLPDAITVSENGSAAITYPGEAADGTPETAAVSSRLYRETERARKAFIEEAGVLREIAGRFTGFVTFKPLSDSAKVRILVRQVVHTGLEYGVQVSYIAPGLLQELAAAAAGPSALSVRSYKAVIEGYLTPLFMEQYTRNVGRIRLEGTLAQPVVQSAE